MKCAIWAFYASYFLSSSFHAFTTFTCFLGGAIFSSSFFLIIFRLFGNLTSSKKNKFYVHTFLALTTVCCCNRLQKSRNFRFLVRNNQRKCHNKSDFLTGKAEDISQPHLLHFVIFLIQTAYAVNTTSLISSNCFCFSFV